MIYVRNKFDGKVFKELEETSSEKSKDLIERAIKGARLAKAEASHKRAQILEDASKEIEKNLSTFAETIAIEAGKPIKYARKEAWRATITMKFSGEESKRIYGQTIPFDAEPRGAGMFAYYVKEPIGAVFAITPFNDPLNLVAHKVGPAIAAGNSIIIKPSIVTPVSAVLLVQSLLRSGLNPGIAQLILASGHSEAVRQILENPVIKLVTFTGGSEAAEDLVRNAGIKKYAMELGSNCPVILWSDTNLEKVIPEVVDAAFECQGQNCIHAQRILIHDEIYDRAREMLVHATENLRIGDPLLDSTDIGPMIAEGEAKRVEEWVNESKTEGARVLCGGTREGSMMHPTVLENVNPKSKVLSQEIFGPATCLIRIHDIEETIEISNSVPYGLQAGAFTNRLDVAEKLVDNLQFGGVLINQTSDFRVDFMPFGGYKMSGLGREGIRFAIDEMTEIKLVVYKKNVN